MHIDRWSEGPTVLALKEAKLLETLKIVLGLPNIPDIRNCRISF